MIINRHSLAYPLLSKIERTITVAEEKLNLPHSLVLEERESLTVSGVSDVDSFDEDMITAYTSLGELTVKGSELHISKLDTETGELSVEGNIQSLIYSSDRADSGGFFSRIFR